MLAPTSSRPFEGREQLRHQIALTTASVAVLASLAGWQPSPGFALAIAAGAAMIGMPHGALDVVVGPSAVQRHWFFPMYGALAGLTVMLWLVAPLASLMVFFAASWYHFGSGDAAHHRGMGAMRWLVGAATGGAAIGLPLLLHADLVTPILNDLLLGRNELGRAQVASIGAAISVVAIGAGLVAVRAAAQSRRFEVIVEVAAIMLLGALVHPLVSFAVYFALWHSPRHLADLDLDVQALAPTMLASLGTIGAGVLFWLIVEPSSALATQVTFIGLAALTTPHLLVTEMVRLPRPEVSRQVRTPIEPSLVSSGASHA